MEFARLFNQMHIVLPITDRNLYDSQLQPWFDLRKIQRNLSLSGKCDRYLDNRIIWSYKQFK